LDVLRLSAPFHRIIVLVLLTATAALVGVSDGRADGTATLKVTKNTTLTADFSGNVVIAKDGVTLDCAGHRIIGNGTGRGVTVDTESGVTVKNCDVSNFATGFWVASTSASTFEDDVSHDNKLAGQSAGLTVGAGFWLQSSSGNTLLSNSGHDNPSDGFDAVNSSNNLIRNNTSTRNGLAGWFLGNGSMHNTLRDDAAGLNGASGFILAGGASNNTLYGNIAQSNAASGFVIDAHFHPATGNVLEANYALANTMHGFLVDFGASANSLSGNTATGNDTGFTTANGSSNNALTNNDADSNTTNGFRVINSANGNTLEGNTATSNDNGFGVNNASNNELANNVADSNASRGFVVVFGATNNTLEGNSAANNGTGCSTCGGFIVVSASMNELRGNGSNSNQGYGFGLFSATSNSLSDNAGLRQLDLRCVPGRGEYRKRMD
jgi:parallel beta-helix repeat protein